MNKDQIMTLAKAIAQEISQMQAQTTSQSIQEELQGIQGSTQEKSSFVENKAEEINSGEAHRSAVLSMTRQWNNNDKALVEKSFDYDAAMKAQQLAQAKWDFAVQQKRDNIALKEAQDASIIKHLANMEYVKFNAAVSEPIAPNTQDAGNIPD